MNEETQFIESDQYSNKDKNLSYNIIILNQIQRITQLASKEMRGGYYKEIPVKLKEGVIGLKKVYVEDTKAAYTNAINVLHDLLIYHFDKEMEKQSKNFSEKEDVNSKRKLFQELTKFIKRKKILDSSSYEY